MHGPIRRQPHHHHLPNVPSRIRRLQTALEGGGGSFACVKLPRTVPFLPLDRAPPLEKKGGSGGGKEEEDLFAARCGGTR